MTCSRHAEFSLTDGHDAPEAVIDCLRAAATALQPVAAEVEPLAQLNAATATAIEALRRDVEALIPIVEFIPMVCEGSPCLGELQQLAKARMVRIAEKIGQITHQAESSLPALPGGASAREWLTTHIRRALVAGRITSRFGRDAGRLRPA